MEDIFSHLGVSRPNKIIAIFCVITFSLIKWGIIHYCRNLKDPYPGKIPLNLVEVLLCRK